jgi:hypothetical protein
MWKKYSEGKDKNYRAGFALVRGASTVVDCGMIPNWTGSMDLGPFTTYYQSWCEGNLVKERLKTDFALVQDPSAVEGIPD